MRSIASTSSTTCSRKTSATDRGMLIAGSGRPRVLGPIELRALITRGRPCRLDRSPLTPPAPADTPRRSESELDFGRFRQREREHFPCAARYGTEFLYCLGLAGT